MNEKLSLQKVMSHFHERWATLADGRKANNNMRYAGADGVLAAFAVFFMQSSSFLAHQRLLQSKKGRSNAGSLFQIEQIPMFIHSIDTQMRLNRLICVSIEIYRSKIYAVPGLF